MARRERYEMPADVYQGLVDSELMSTYEERPSFQRNDYLGWIGRAKQPATRRKRLDQMLAELDEGGVYMKMDHPPSARC